MARRALPRPIEVGAAGVRIAGEQALQRIIAADIGTVRGLLYAQVQEGHDVLNGVVGQWQGGHAVVRTAVADDGPDQVAA